MSAVFKLKIIPVIFLIFVFGSINAKEKTFTRISDIRLLSHTEAEKQNNVELTAIITYAFDNSDMGFLQDSTAGIFFRANSGEKPELGDLVKVSAKTGAGEFAPILNEIIIKVIGKATLPKTSKSSISDIINGHKDSQWIGVSGVIKSVKYNESMNSVQMRLDMSGRSIDVYVYYKDKHNLPFHLLGSTVYVEGVCGADFNHKKQLLGIRLFVQNMDQLKVIKSESINAFKKEPLLINQILQFSTTYNSDERIRFQGIVTYQNKHKIYVMDSTASIVVHTNAAYDFENGDKIDIVGFAVAGEFNPEIENGLCKKIGSGYTVKPFILDSLTSLEELQDAALVRIEARLSKIVNQNNYSTLYLEKDSTLFQAEVKNEFISSITELYEMGSIVNLTGVLQLEVNSDNIQKTDTGVKIPETLKIILRNTDDLTLIQPPPWFTFEKALGLLAGLGILIFLSFGWVYFLKRKVTQKTQDLISSQKEKDVILQNVEEGFFLLNNNLVIQSQYSAALLDIMETTSPAEKSFADFLTAYLKKEEIEIILDYAKLVLDHTIDVQSISELNPLNRMVFHFKDDKGISYPKYLTFDFKRVFYKAKTSGIIVTVIDETEEFKLAEKLSQSEENSKKQIEWITSIINLDPQILQEFIDTTDTEIISLKDKIKTDDHSHHGPMLDHIARSLHLIKGNASLLELNFFSRHAHHLEDLALSIQANNEIDGSDFLPLVIGIQDFKNNMTELKALIHKLSTLNVRDSQGKTRKENTVIDFVQKMVVKEAKKLNKQVSLNSEGFKTEIIPPRYLFTIKNVLIQMVRNSLAHGIEDPEVRTGNNKPENGQINIKNYVEGNNFILKFSDDGQGLQVEKLKEKALEFGTWDRKEIDGWDNNDLTAVIFKPGISAKDSATIISGRGVGMDLIKSQLDKFNGTIDVDFKEGAYCKFTISLPLTNVN